MSATSRRVFTKSIFDAAADAITYRRIKEFSNKKLLSFRLETTSHSLTLNAGYLL